MHTFNARLHNTLSHDLSTIMAPIDEVIAFLHSSDDRNTSAIVRRFGIDRITLSRRFHGKTGSMPQRLEQRRPLNNKQEAMLIKQIWRLCEWCLPPTPVMVRSWASLICGSEPGKNWSADFRRRIEAVLNCRYLNTLDIERHQAEDESSFRQYFAVLQEKIDLYGI
jgi:hypothetical protein